MGGHVVVKRELRLPTLLSREVTHHVSSDTLEPSLKRTRVASFKAIDGLKTSQNDILQYIFEVNLLPQPPPDHCIDLAQQPGSCSRDQFLERHSVAASSSRDECFCLCRFRHDCIHFTHSSVSKSANVSRNLEKNLEPDGASYSNDLRRSTAKGSELQAHPATLDTTTGWERCDASAEESPPSESDIVRTRFPHARAICRATHGACTILAQKGFPDGKRPAHPPRADSWRWASFLGFRTTRSAEINAPSNSKMNALSTLPST